MFENKFSNDSFFKSDFALFQKCLSLPILQQTRGYPRTCACKGKKRVHCISNKMPWSTLFLLSGNIWKHTLSFMSMHCFFSVFPACSQVETTFDVVKCSGHGNQYWCL